MATPLTLAQTDSFAVWENIADGTLTSTWTERTNANWKGQNESGIWSYNNTATNSLNWTYNSSITGSRWMQTWEATCDDAEGGIGSAMFVDSSHYYAVIYYLSFNGSTPAIYIIYYNAGTVNYWDSTPGTWTTNRSNATDYTDYEKDYYNDWVRFKAIWNWNEAFDNCTVRFKAWETPGDEFPLWLCDAVITASAPVTSTYPGLVVDKRWDLDSSITLFRRIAFFNLSYTMTPGLNHVIECPTYSATAMMDDWADAEDFDDVWNATQIYKDFINEFDLTSFYDEDFWGETGNQNDTTYVFSMVITDFRDFVDMFFDPVPPDTPDNIVIFRMFVPIDGTSNESDYCLIRWDTDNDGTYDADDVAFWTNDTNTYMYEGWTQGGAEGYCIFGSGASTGVFGGDIFRDEMYYCYTFVLNWDMMYNGSSGERIGDDQCRMSMMFYDNDTDSISTLQDFYPSDDDDHYLNTDGHNATDTPTWEDWNTSTFWTLFTIDEGITGEQLSDPEDPESIYDDLDPQTTTIIQEILPVLIAVAVLGFIVTFAFTVGLTKETLITLMVITILGIIVIQVILGL